MASNHLREIQAEGQAVWLDNISRALIEDGELQRLVDEDGISGVTSNPSIFDKAFGSSDRYDDAIRELAEAGKDARDIFFELGFKDIRDGCDILRDTFDATEGKDGYVSFELPPELADDAQGSVEQAKLIKERIDRPNVLIKVPATEAGVEAFEELTAAGVNVNVTLLFDVRRYEAVAEAYVRGVERRVEAGEPVDRASSVASFFVSRVDGKIDDKLDELGREDLKGKAAVANARVAYESFQRIFSGERWEKLAAAGAAVQRPLWASTSTKNPDYPDTLYVDELIGPDTVNTMPDATIEAARDHGTAARTVDKGFEDAHKLMDELREIGVDVDEIVGRVLVDEGVESFAKAFNSMIDTIAEKAGAVTAG
jgi:transaldolase